jgi:hypothetical protein
MKTPFLPPPAKIQQTVQIARQAVPSDLTQQPTLNSMAVSLPLSDEGDDPVTLPPQPKGEDIPEEEPTRRSHADVSSSTFKALSAAEIDEWPTRSVHDAAELAALASQSAPSQSDFKAAPPRSPAPSASAIPTASSSPAPSPSQSPAADQAEFKEPRLTHAVRVVVWRDADGVHVAPHGTPVRAFTVDAMLVALEEDEDLAGLLGKRRR